MAIQVHANSYKVIGLDRRSHIGQINAANALRKRIRTLIEEARREEKNRMGNAWADSLERTSND